VALGNDWQVFRTYFVYESVPQLSLLTALTRTRWKLTRLSRGDYHVDLYVGLATFTKTDEPCLGLDRNREKQPKSPPLKFEGGCREAAGGCSWCGRLHRVALAIVVQSGRG